MKTFLKLILILFGVLLIGNTMIMAMVSNFNAGIIVSFLVGLIMLLYGTFFNKIHRENQKGILRLIRYTIYAGTLFSLGMIVFIASYGQVDTTDYSENAVIILGAGIRGETVSLPLAYRLDKGIEYYWKNPDAIIVVSGGQGPEENITEALAMERYLINRGIPQDKIIKEEKSTNTFENFRFSKEILDRHFKHEYRTVFITNDFHIYRAEGIAIQAGLTITRLHAHIDWYIMPVTYLREIFAVMKFWIFKN